MIPLVFVFCVCDFDDVDYGRLPHIRDGWRAIGGFQCANLILISVANATKNATGRRLCSRCRRVYTVWCSISVPARKMGFQVSCQTGVRLIR